MREIYKYSIFSIIIMFLAFSFGLVRAMYDTVQNTFSTSILIFHIIFAGLTGGFGVYLYVLANKTGLLFPKFIGLGNLVSIGIAGFSGLSYLLTNYEWLTRLMLYGFEFSLALTSMLIGYLYCFMRYR
ncbi:hypothetical protein SULI_12290 [Saccharolobus solfataricus]|nr:hypothetical protein [Saccharolobus solfataricus]AKA74567.1 hypothetical protein SULB_2426 [Saccharolobus solfataricus]AKA77263.1 hypothetical protein SULC_2423 [Saccharolobus solfataricus]AKA79955.1 hypothetical protein SULA_2425 [Saccharolobus solfataricus]AZF69041.1 hypothetical protein SULG_12290 [Saccharolobus solfataricus]AZF71661.1 hypothetical protein SULH_12290 [Saccharolobus solfataricus]